MDPALRSALAVVLRSLVGEGALEVPPPAPAAALPPWCSTAEYAAARGFCPRTVAGWARRAPRELAIRYGNRWRLAGPAFDRWVQNGGPNRHYEDEPREQVH